MAFSSLGCGSVDGGGRIQSSTLRLSPSRIHGLPAMSDDPRPGVGGKGYSRNHLSRGDHKACQDGAYVIYYDPSPSCHKW